MTTRLYYHDSLLARFDANVVEAGEHEGRPTAVLDRTAFYPTSGGQPFDTGTLNGVRVLDVIDRESDHAVVHIMDRPLSIGEPVTGAIDWARRLDHMQQHSGQHVLSAAFVRVCNAPTVSFHLGADASTIDLAASLDQAQITRAEDAANEVVWEDRPVHVRFATREEAAAMPLRKEPAREGTLRLVEVADFDLSACGGTHVPRTGAIGVIAVSGCERHKGGTRLSFVCGNRALRQFRVLRDAVAAAGRQLSVLPGELPDAITRLQNDARDLRQQSRVLADQLAVHEAAALAGNARDLGPFRAVCAVVSAREAQALKSLAQAIAARPGHLAVLVTDSQPALVVAARASDVCIDASALLRALMAAFGGRGGGRAEMAQGGGLAGPPDAIRRAADEVLSGGAQPSASRSR